MAAAVSMPISSPANPTLFLLPKPPHQPRTLCRQAQSLSLDQNDSERFNINWISDALGLFGCQSDAPGLISKEFVGPYATLSHSWGGMEFLRLTPSKLKSFQRDGVQYLTRETGLARCREEQRWYWTVGLRRETEGQRVEG
jgi:hypothetical protein